MSWLIALPPAKRVESAEIRRRRQFSTVLQFFMNSLTVRRCSYRWRNCAMQKVTKFLIWLNNFRKRTAENKWRWHSHEHFQGFSNHRDPEISSFDSTRAIIRELSSRRFRVLTAVGINSDARVNHRQSSMKCNWSVIRIRLRAFCLRSPYGFSTLISRGVELNELFVYTPSWGFSLALSPWHWSYVKSNSACIALFTFSCR